VLEKGVKSYSFKDNPKVHHEWNHQLTKKILPDFKFSERTGLNKCVDVISSDDSFTLVVTIDHTNQPKVRLTSTGVDFGTITNDNKFIFGTDTVGKKQVVYLNEEKELTDLGEFRIPAAGKGLSRIAFLYGAPFPILWSDNKIFFSGQISRALFVVIF
jgi:hypothetical protein